MEDKTMNKNLLVIIPMGGLANRMRAITSGITLAKAAKFKSKIIWPINKELYSPYEKLFDYGSLPTELKNINNIEDLFLYDLPRKKNIFLSSLLRFGRTNAFYHDINTFASNNEYSPENFYHRIILTGGKQFIRSGLDFFPFEPKTYRNIFKPSKEVEELVCSIGNEMDINSCYGIHIRRTDNRQSISNSPVEIFFSKIEEVISVEPQAIFYLATDDCKLKKVFHDRYGNRIKFNDIELRRDTNIGIKMALLEMLLLSRTKKIYGSYYSSYNESAAMLGNIPLEVLTLK